MTTGFDFQAAATVVENNWPSIEETLKDYIRIPNQSPLFDPEWASNGLIDRCVTLFTAWLDVQKATLPMSYEVLRLPGRTPVILIEVPATRSEDPKTVLLYGHLDKQPPMAEAWEAGLGPYTPVIKDGKLFGRGGADDGYAMFGAITALKAVRAQGGHHGRAVILIEASEESGSRDLPEYVNTYAPRIGQVDLVICLDSGAGDYNRLWVTTSLRGLVAGTLSVDVLKDGVHSGLASGIVPSSFRILRQLLDRIEDPQTGVMKLEALRCPIPPARVTEAAATAAILGDLVYNEFPFLDGVQPALKNPVDLLLARTWSPALSVTGAAGLPTLAAAGNVLRTGTAVKLSIRIPPRVDGATAAAALKAELERDPPYGAKVAFDGDKRATGWDAPATPAWLGAAVDAASQAMWGKPAGHMGEGGTIPFMKMLGDRFPSAVFVVTGVLGPGSNAHGPNEFLHIKFTKNIIASVAGVLHSHATKN